MWQSDSKNIIIPWEKNNFTGIIFVISRAVLELFDYYINFEWIGAGKSILTTDKHHCKLCQERFKNLSGIDRMILNKQFQLDSYGDTDLDCGKISSKDLNSVELVIENDIPVEFIQEIWILNNNELYNSLIREFSLDDKIRNKIINLPNWDEKLLLKDNFPPWKIWM